MSPKYRDLNAPPKQQMADIVRQLKERAQSSKTGAAGVKDLGENGDVVWTGTGPDGQPVEKSVKRFQVELDDTAERARQLEEQIANAREDIANAAEALAEMGRVTTTGPPPPDPVIGKSLWVSPGGAVFRAVECGEETG